MLLQSTFVLISSFSLANALPNLLEGRATCNADDCYRAVVASSHAPGPGSAKADCSSFLLATETLCASTIYVTATVTTTAVPTTITITTTQTSTDIVTNIASVTTTVTTVHDTLTMITSATTTEIDLEISTATLTTTIFAQGLSKRNQKPSSRPRLGVKPDGVERRALTTSTCPSFRTPSAVPTYASACSGTSRYASACSCNGATRSTTTTQSTTTSTITVTGTVSPTITVMTTRIVELPLSLTSSSFIPATLETTDLTTTVLVSATTTQTSISSTTVVVSKTVACSSFIVQATSGTYAGQYLQFQNEHTALDFVTAISPASTFVSLANGQVTPAADTPALFNTFNNNADLVYASSDYVAGGYPLLTCAFGHGATLVSGSFSCRSSNGNTQFLACPAEAAGAGAPASSLIITNGALPGTDCQVLGLLAIPACT